MKRFVFTGVFLMILTITGFSQIEKKQFLLVDMPILQQ